MVIAHPAAAMHHHQLVGGDGGHPFIHVMVDIGDHAPDAWDVNASEAGMAVWRESPTHKRSQSLQESESRYGSLATYIIQG